MPHMPLADGDDYAGLRISGLLGAGATGTVYLATDPRTGDRVALKILRAGPSSDAAFRQLLTQTNESLTRLRIPGATRIIDFGELRGRFWVSTEYVPGIDADALLHQHFPSGVAHRSLCVIVDKVAHTLDAAHGARLLHRDVKPANIIVDDPFSSDYRLMLTDFAHGTTDPSTKPFRYAAPELLSGHRAGPRSDQFALAATAFHLLTGSPAFIDPDRTTIGVRHLEFNEGALAAVPNAPSGLREVFVRAFAVNPARRFASCNQFAAAFRAPIETLDTTTTYLADQDDAPRTNRSALVIAGIALVVAVAATVAVVTTSKSRPESVPVAAGQHPSAAAPATPTVSSQCQQLNAAIGQLQPREKLAQLLMVGVKNLEDAQTVVHDQAVGGIFIGSWTDLAMMGPPLLALEGEGRPIPLAVSVDEEGGRVERLKSLIGPQYSPRELVAAGKTPDQVREIAKQRGLAMKNLGITIDFAPVVDTTDADADTVIGDRSFSNDPQQVVKYAGAYADGLRDAGLLPVLKHFPGHGHASGDSHKTGVVTPPLSTLKSRDLIPYIALTQEAPVAVMIGHMQVPGLTNGQQASLSPAAYDLLRKGGYGEGAQPFTGPIFTDDLSSMRAITNEYDVPTAVLIALKAGADTALWITTKEVPGVLDRLAKAVQDGDLTQGRVDDALRHMAVAKNPDWAACTA
jgi:beta-glucosidase-like glycosyl hydrolase/serine/threonine protein kinase